MLVGGGDDLVARAETEPRADDVAPVGRARRERDVIGGHSDEATECLAHLVSQLEETQEVGHPGTALAEIAVELPSHRRDHRAGERAEGAGVEVRDVLEHGKKRTCLAERHARILAQPG